jgi:hypothetical protein
MHADMSTEIRITLTADEYRLIGLALCGKLKDKADKEAAACLNKKLLESRLQYHKDQVDRTQKAIDSLGSDHTA